MTSPSTETGRERILRPPLPVDLRITLWPLRRGRLDPCMRIGPGGTWRATRTPVGPATTHLGTDGVDVVVRAWGPGADWALEAAPSLIGGDDRLEGFEPRHPLVAELHRRLAGLRMGRSLAVTEALVPSILEQKVVGLQARRSYAGLVRALGEPAPGPAPAGLTVPPPASVWAATPGWVFHRHGVEGKRADAVRLACSCSRRLEEAVSLPPADARRRLTALPGIGAWTAAEVARVALGDPDAVSVGDFHLPDTVAWALAGEPRADDRRMLELLAPWPGHRGRVVRLIEAGGRRPPRYGPRLALQDIAAL